jgi:hypothetical protein
MKKRPMFFAALVAAAFGLLASIAGAAGTNAVAPITFEPDSGYTVGNINGQGADVGNTWLKSGPYDAAVASATDFPAIGDLGFETQALRISNAVTSGSFGDQTFSPSVTPAVTGTAQHKFASSFSIGTTSPGAQQPGLAISVSPDNGQGARMSYLRFEDQPNGVHVFFDQARGATFKESDIATLDRTIAHTIAFSIDFSASASKAVTISIDGLVKATGSTWESYYQTQEHNPTPSVSTMLFRASGTAAGTVGSGGFLIDNLSVASS